MKQRIREEDFCYIIAFENGIIDIFKKSTVDILDSKDTTKFLPHKMNELPPDIRARKCIFKAPIMVGLHITNSCNLHCKHCYMRAGKKFKNEMSLEEIKNLLDYLKEMGVMFIFITGGEPTLRPDFVDIVNYLHHIDIDFNILTNGTLLSNDILDQIPNTTTFNVSFDGFKSHEVIRNVNSHTYLFDLFKRLKEKKFPFLTHYVLQKDNMEDLLEVYDWCEKNEIILAALDLWPVGRAMDHPEIFPTENDLKLNKKIMGRKLKYELKSSEFFNKTFQNPSVSNPGFINLTKKISHLSGLNYPGSTFAFITSDGHVYPDNYHAGDKIMCAGNIRKTPFGEIWTNGFDKIRNLTFEKFPCRNCEIIKQGFDCDLQMPVYSYNLHKNFNSCGATEFLKKAMLDRNLIRQKKINALPYKDALTIDNF
jgi:MoaA/NifB/PqqE/SkfB family radical SAM enzyme